MNSTEHCLCSLEVKSTWLRHEVNTQGPENTLVGQCSPEGEVWMPIRHLRQLWYHHQAPWPFPWLTRSVLLGKYTLWTKQRIYQKSLSWSMNNQCHCSHSDSNLWLPACYTGELCCWLTLLGKALKNQAKGPPKRTTTKHMHWACCSELRALQK